MQGLLELTARAAPPVLAHPCPLCAPPSPPWQASAAEIVKGNQIIGKLQSDVRSLKAKLKLRASEAQQQVDALGRKQQAVDAAERTAADLRAQLVVAQSDKAKAEEACAEHKRQLTEAQDLLRSNQQVIQWLNKELNEVQAGNRVNSAAALLAAAKGAAYRPSLPRLGGGVIERPASMSACDSGASTSALTLPQDAAGEPKGLGGFRSELRSKAALAALSEGSSNAAAGSSSKNAEGGEAGARTMGFSEYLAPSIATSC